VEADAEADQQLGDAGLDAHQDQADAKDTSYGYPGGLDPAPP